MSIEVQPLLEPIKEVEDYLRKDIPLNGLPLFDFTLAWDSNDWFIARENNKLAGCLIVYKGGRGLYSFFTRGRPKVVEQLIASMEYPSVFAIVPPEHRSIVEKYYQFLSQGEFLLLNLEESRYQMPKLHSTVKLSATDFIEVDAFYQSTFAGAWNPSQLSVGPFYGIRKKSKLVSICGTIGVYPVSPGVSVIGNLITLPKYQNRGYGTSVLCSVINDLFSKYRYVTLMVESENQNAIRIYRRLGFIIHANLSFGICQRRE